LALTPIKRTIAQIEGLDCRSTDVLDQLRRAIRSQLAIIAQLFRSTL